VTPPDLSRKRSFVVTLGLLTAIAALTVDVSLPAVPAMVEALATSLSQGQRIVGIFMAGMAFGQIPAGLLSDRVGRLPVLFAGTILFAIGATVATVANDIHVILAARMLQGFGAASAVVLSRAIVRDISRGKESARLMSLMTMIFTAVPVIAPSIGAFLVAHLGWRAPFVMIAVCGYMIIIASRIFLVETHAPSAGQHPVRQLLSSFREFFSHRQSIFGLLLVILLPAGFMSVITVSSALVVETYGYSVQAFGFVFACSGVSILVGAAVNRALVPRFDLLQMISIGVTLIGISGSQLLIIAWLDQAPLWWLWGCVCVFMFTIAILMPNAVVIALDPLPKIAGVASSIIGTLQNAFGASGALVGALIYNGSIRHSILIMATVAMLVVTIFMLRPIIAPGPLLHHPDELARD
jgi:MFS transporter, DHA1 family, multidrug resistance protein